MAAQLQHPEYSPGLQGIPAGITRISRIDVERSSLTYRGYDVHILAEHTPVEETAYLVLNGELPTKAQLDAFTKNLVSEREIPSKVYDVMRCLPTSSHPMAWLQTLVSAVALHDPESADNSHDANIRKATRLFAKMGTVVANGYRVVHEGKEPVAPDSSLGHAANFLYMLKGTKPMQSAADVINTSMILYMEHDFNCSTFTARVIVSSNSDLYSGTVGAIGALKGNLHGGANEAAMEMLLEIGSVEKAHGFIDRALAEKKKIMGFGHREYRKSDSRVPILKKVGKKLSEDLGNMKWWDIAEILEKDMWDAKQLFPNVDFPAAWLYYLLELPIHVYTPIFAVARTVGWSAHMIEQLDSNRIIRPQSIYEGQMTRDFVPIEER